LIANIKNIQIKLCSNSSQNLNGNNAIKYQINKDKFKQDVNK